MFRGNLLCSNLCSLPLVMSLGTTEKSLVPTSVLPYHIFIDVDKILLSPPFSSLQALSASPHITGSVVPSSSLWHFIRLCPVAPYLVCTEEPRTGHSNPDVALPMLNRVGGKNLLLWPAGNIPNAAWDAVGLLCVKDTLLIYSLFVVHQTAEFLLWKCFQLAVCTVAQGSPSFTKPFISS